MTQQRYIRSPILVLLLFLLTVGLLFLLTKIGWAFPQVAQSISPLAPAIPSNVAVQQQGNIEYAYVTLDGEQLFPVTANTTPDQSKAGVSPVQQRIRSIEPTLHRIVEQDFDPQDLYITVAALDRQTVILASNPIQNTKEVILTVTDLDAQLAGKPISTLANDWSDIIHRALLQGWTARRPNARQRQFFQVMMIALVIVIASLVFYGVHRWIYNLFDRRRQHLLESAEEQLTFALQANATELNQDFKQIQALKQRQMLNVALRRLLRLAQLLVWSGGIAWILGTIPETRSLGKSLVTFLIKLFIILLTMFVVAQICRILVNQRLRILVEESSVNPEEMQRMVLRAPTVASVMNELIQFVVGSVAIVLLIDWEQIPIASIWTGAGLLSVAFSLVFQNLLRDWLNGFLIIFGDHYAVGDTVKIADVTGLVESMSLRTTRIRGVGGSLNSIPHGQITTVHNLTKDWSRVDFNVTIASETNIVYAIEVMKKVADDMVNDPAWRSEILEPVSSIGLDRITTAGTKVSMSIRTKRSKQWAVEKELRYRLKLAFDQAGIHVGAEAL